MKRKDIYTHFFYKKLVYSTALKICQVVFRGLTLLTDPCRSECFLKIPEKIIYPIIFILNNSMPHKNFQKKFCTP